MTHKLLDKITQKIIYRSAVRPITKSNPNHRLDIDGVEFGASMGDSEGSKPTKTPKVPTVFIRSRQDDAGPSIIKPMPEFDPDNLIGRTSLLPPQENGERLRAKVTKKVVEEIEAGDGNRTPNINFMLDVGEGKVEELITYNQLLDHLEQADEQDKSMDQELYRFRATIGHEGPLKATNPNWKGSKWNVQIEWETGESTFEPLSVIAADDPITCAAYAKEKNLYNLDGWKRFRHLIKKEKKLTRTIKQSKIRQVRHAKKYMFGFLIPRNYTEAWNLIKLTITVNGMMPQRLNWTLYIHIRYSRSMKKLNMISKRKSLMHSQDIRKSEFILFLQLSMMADIKPDLLLMDILLQNPLKVLTQELFH